MRSAACPSDDALLRLSSNELRGRPARSVRDHVEHCVRCRERLASYHRVLEDYRRLVGAGDDGREAARTGEFRRLMRAETQARPRAGVAGVRWAAQAAVILVIAGALFLWTRHAEVALSAEALIARAVEGERAAPATSGEAVSIATASARPPAGATASTRARAGARHIAAVSAEAQSAAGGERVAERGQMTQELARRLVGHWFDWRVPLSARPFQHWRASIAEPQDSVEWIDASRIRVSTISRAGPIASAELELEVPSYRPVGHVWRFADGFEVELRATPIRPQQPSGPRPSPETSAVAASLRPAVPVATGLDDAEVQTRHALERLHVRLGRHLTVRRSRSGLVIEGRVGGGDLARAVAKAAAEIPRVESRVRTGPPAAAEASPLPGPTPALALWLDRTFGAGPLRDTFLGDARELRGDLADAGRTLRELAVRYPRTVTDRLPARTRARLDDLAQAYYVRLVTSFERLEQHLAPLTGTLGRPMLPGRVPGGWRNQARGLVDAIDEVDAAFDTLADPTLTTGDALEDRARDVLRPALAAVATATRE